MKHLKRFEAYISDKHMKSDNYIDTLNDIDNSTAWEEMPEGEKEKLEDAYADELDNVFDKTNEVKCLEIENPLAPEIEFSDCVPALTFNDVMKPFIREVKRISSISDEAYTLNSFLTRWVKEYKDFQKKSKGILL